MITIKTKEIFFKEYTLTKEQEQSVRNYAKENEMPVWLALEQCVEDGLINLEDNEPEVIDATVEEYDIKEN